MNNATPNTVSQRHIMHTALDYMQTATIYARAQSFIFGVNSTESHTTKADETITIRHNGVEHKCRNKQTTAINTLQVIKSIYNLQDNTLLLSIKSSQNLQNIQQDPILFFTERDSYLQSTFLLICKCNAAAVYCKDVKLNKITPTANYNKSCEYNITYDFSASLSCPGTIGVKLQNFCNTLWPDDCTQCEIYFKINRNYFLSDVTSHKNIFFNILQLDNITSIVSDPWQSKDNCSCYTITQPEDYSIQSIEIINGYNYSSSLQWHKHHLNQSQSFYSYQDNTSGDWAIELDPPAPSSMTLNAEINVTPNQRISDTDLQCCDDRFNTVFCGSLTYQAACDDLAMQIGWQRIIPTDIASLQKILQFHDPPKTVTALALSITSFSYAHSYAQVKGSFHKTISCNLHIKKTGFAREIIFFFGFFVRQLLQARLNENTILIINEDTYERLTFKDENDFSHLCQYK
jgi:hypothetical protein